MDTDPLNTSILILCSEVGFTFGNEIMQMLSHINIYIYICIYIRYIYKLRSACLSEAVGGIRPFAEVSLSGSVASAMSQSWQGGCPTEKHFRVDSRCVLKAEEH